MLGYQLSMGSIDFVFLVLNYDIFRFNSYNNQKGRFNMLDTFNQLQSQGFNVSLLTLQKIHYLVDKNDPSKGKTFSWAYSNRMPQQPVTAFGTSMDGISYSGWDAQAKRPISAGSSNIIDGKIHTFWLNGIDDETIEIWKMEHGEQAIGYFDADDNQYLLSETEARELLPPAPPSSSDEASQQA